MVERIGRPRRWRWGLLALVVGALVFCFGVSIGRSMHGESGPSCVLVIALLWLWPIPDLLDRFTVRGLWARAGRAYVVGKAVLSLVFASLVASVSWLAAITGIGLIVEGLTDERPDSAWFILTMPILVLVAAAFGVRLLVSSFDSSRGPLTGSPIRGRTVILVTFGVEAVALSAFAAYVTTRVTEVITEVAGTDVATAAVETDGWWVQWISAVALEVGAGLALAAVLDVVLLRRRGD